MVLCSFLSETVFAQFFNAYKIRFCPFICIIFLKAEGYELEQKVELSNLASKELPLY